MKSWDLGRHALTACAAAAMLAGCGGSPPPIAAPGAVPHGSVTTKRGEQRKSWILPEAKNQNLLYISDQLAGGVFVYTYQPPRYKFVGLLTEAATPAGECVDQAQDLFVTNFAVTFEYNHGGAQPIRVLGDPGGTPNSCSIDPTTGNLAVTAAFIGPPSALSLAVYKRGRGRPTLYPTPDFNYMAFCTYDDHGDLFVDGGRTSGNAFLVEELPSGGGGLIAIKTKPSLQYPGGMQWLGNHLLIGDLNHGIVYQFSVKDGKAHETGSTPLTGSPNIEQFLVTGSRIIVPSGNVGEKSGWVNFYPYPAGGLPTRNLPNFGLPYAAVISRAAK